MKANKSTYVLFILLVGAGFLMYRYSNWPNIPSDPINQKASVVDTIEKTPENRDIFYVEDGEELMYSDTSSFSNAESNSKIKKEGIFVKNSDFENKQATAPYKKINVSKPITKDATLKRSVFGMFYTDTLSAYGYESCIGKRVNNLDKSISKRLSYTQENFVLTKILTQGKNAYLFVDAYMVPYNICGQIVLFPSQHTRMVQNIYVLVNKK